MKTCFTLPTGESVTLLCIGKGFHGILHYLHSVRSGKATEGAAAEYENMKTTYANQLAALVGNEVPDADTLVVPPSSRDDTAPYGEAILQKQVLLQDLSGQFSRNGNVRAADNDTALDQVIEEYVYAPSGSEPTTKSLLILDETVGSGKTAAAILHHLRAAGLPSDCKVTIATARKVSNAMPMYANFGLQSLADSYS